jgi:hypothetical protein
MDSQDIYSLCLTAHVFNWMESGQKLKPVEYLEFNAGPILSHFMRVYGIEIVVNDFQKKISIGR